MRYSCKECDKTLGNHNSLRKHIELEHFHFKYNCQLCSKGFTQKNNLDEHIKSQSDKTCYKMKCNL